MNHKLSCHQIPAETIEHMPPMATQHAKVDKAKGDAIFSSLPTQKKLPTLNITDNLSRGVQEEKEENPKAMNLITQVEEKKDKVKSEATEEKRDEEILVTIEAKKEQVVV